MGMDSSAPHTVSWQDPRVWDQVVSHFQALFSAGHDFSPLLPHVGTIEQGYDGLDPAMDFLTRAVCPTCSDNCCGRAVIGYDFVDLLFHGLAHGQLPPAQISKMDGGDGNRVCRCLGALGCTLSRSHRPFICTWYLCAGMKSMDESGEIQGKIKAVQKARRELENELYAVLQGKPVI